MFTVRMIGLCEFGFHPPYALVMNLFHHSYKLAANKLDDDVTVVMRTIVASPWKQSVSSIHRRIFLECLRRHWVKLCEVVLCSVSLNAPQLSRILDCMFTATHVIGTTCQDFSVKLGKKQPARECKKFGQHVESKKSSNVLRTNKLVEGMLVEKVVANIYLAHVLVTHADSLKIDSINDSEKQNSQRSKKGLGYRGSLRRVVTAEQIKKERLSEQQESLYETAITLASRAFAVKNFTCHQLQMENFNYDYNFLEFMQRSLK